MLIQFNILETLKTKLYIKTNVKGNLTLPVHHHVGQEMTVVLVLLVYEGETVAVEEKFAAVS